MTRGIARDLTNVRFGHLVALYRNGSDGQSNALWFCRCDCGTETNIRAVFLQKQQTYCSKQCPLYSNGMRLDISGQRYGRLTALAFVKPSGKSGKTVWSFRCDCGDVAEINATNVLTGHIKSCGCFGKESRVKHGESQTRAYHRAAHKEWAKRNPAKVIANALNRTKALRARIPRWLTDEHWEQINAKYLEAKRLTEETGIVHHVDHEIPLRGKLVSGLHVPWNLQVLTRDENLRKANSFG